MKKNLTQAELILRHLKELGGITSWEAFKEYGITRLSAIIFDLKKAGNKIDSSEWITKKNRYNEKVSFIKYRLISTKEL